MDVTSILNNQTIIQSTAVNEGKTEAELAAEDAEQQRVDFLNLLLTQLENQNPLDPMDTDEWTAQLTRYSQLEQQIETNEKLTVQNSLLADSTTSTTFAFIGQDVEVNTNTGVVQDGEATWSYEVQGQADEVIITITDGEGNLVAADEGSKELGVHGYTLDAAALGLPEGQQLIFNVASKFKDNDVNTEITSHLTVDGVWNDTKETFLTAGDISFRTSDVLKVAPQVGGTQTTVADNTAVTP